MLLIILFEFLFDHSGQLTYLHRPFASSGALAMAVFSLVESGRSGVRSRLRCGDFSGSSHTSGYPVRGLALKLIGSALGLDGLVSVYCDCARKEVCSATAISVWQHVSSSAPEIH